MRIRLWLALVAACAGAHTAVAAADPADGPTKPLRLAAERDKYSGAPLPPQKKLPIPSPITDHFYVKGTAYFSKLDTLLRVDNGVGVPGTLVSAERDLGLRQSVTQGHLELMFRMRERNRLRVDYYDSDRTGQKQLTRTINFGDETFILNDLATTALQWRIFGLTYTYSFLRTERFELGGGLGAYLLQGEATGEVQARALRQEVSGVAAFPTVALDAAWRISRRFALTVRGQYLHAAVNNFSGSLGDYHADLQYRWKPNFAIGLGFSELRISLNVDGGSFPGILDVKTRGPEAFFRVSF